MKTILLTLLAFTFVSCNKDNSSNAPIPQVEEVTIIEADSISDEETVFEEIDEEVIEIDDAPEAPAEIVEENTECICTKDFRPVCGANGQTYPNSCQAECDGMTDYKEGACE